MSGAWPRGDRPESQISEHMTHDGYVVGTVRVYMLLLAGKRPLGGKRWVCAGRPSCPHGWPRDPQPSGTLIASACLCLCLFPFLDSSWACLSSPVARLPWSGLSPFSATKRRLEVIADASTGRAVQYVVWVESKYMRRYSTMDIHDNQRCPLPTLKTTPHSLIMKSGNGHHLPHAS